MVSDVYSKKDSNLNRKIELKQSHIMLGILSICVVTFGVIATVYYYDTHSIQTVKTAAPVEPPGIVSGQGHTYDASVPPYKQ